MNAICGHEVDFIKLILGFLLFSIFFSSLLSVLLVSKKRKRREGEKRKGERGLDPAAFKIFSCPSTQFFILNASFFLIPHKSSHTSLSLLLFPAKKTRKKLWWIDCVVLRPSPHDPSNRRNR